MVNFHSLDHTKTVFSHTLAALFNNMRTLKFKAQPTNAFCDNSFLGRLGLLSLLQQSEGNTLAATEFIRLLEASGSVTAKRSNGTREKTQLLGSNSRV